MSDDGPNIDGLRLFRVEVTQDIWVLAADATTAELDAPKYAREDWGEPDCFATEMKNRARVDADTLTCLPHWDREGDPPTIGDVLTMIGERT